MPLHVIFDQIFLGAHAPFSTGLPNHIHAFHTTCSSLVYYCAGAFLKHRIVFKLLRGEYIHFISCLLISSQPLLKIKQCPNQPFKFTVTRITAASRNQQVQPCDSCSQNREAQPIPNFTPRSSTTLAHSNKPMLFSTLPILLIFLIAYTSYICVSKPRPMLFIVCKALQW